MLTVHQEQEKDKANLMEAPTVSLPRWQARAPLNLEPLTRELTRG